MSIVKGANGFLNVAANLLPDGGYTVLLWVKRNTVADYTFLWEHRNTATNYVKLETRAGPLRALDAQEFGSGATTVGSCTVNTWHPVLIQRDAAGNGQYLETDFEGSFSQGSSGLYQTPVSPETTLFADVANTDPSPDGTKIGAFVVYDAELDATDIAHLIGGGDPQALPSETTPTALWIDSAGVVKDGSDNVTSWTDEIGGLVLSPSGTITVDNADMAPITFAGVNPAVSMTSALRPGQPFTVVCSNFASAPVSPVTLTPLDDQGDPIAGITPLTVPVTITDNGDGTYDADGTMPALPAAGNSQASIPFGDVRVEISS